MQKKDNVILSKCSFWGMGGKADAFFITEMESETVDLWQKWHKNGEKVMILGKGSNTCFHQDGFRGNILVLGQKNADWQQNTVYVESGMVLQSFVEQMAGKGFADLVNLSGIPGTIGGAIRGNAGAFGTEVCDAVLEVKYVDNEGNIGFLPTEKCEWGYRTSFFKHNPLFCVLGARFGFEKVGNADELTQKVKELHAHRWQKYPKGRSGGSFFKNPEGDYAGRLLEAVGAKEMTQGGVQVSAEHANFVMNRKNGTQADVLLLMHTLKSRVLTEFGVDLEPEVVLVGENGEKITF